MELTSLLQRHNWDRIMRVVVCGPALMDRFMTHRTSATPASISVNLSAMRRQPVHAVHRLLTGGRGFVLVKFISTRQKLHLSWDRLWTQELTSINCAKEQDFRPIALAT
ncbi:hypothetical protein D3C72_1566440 [compost metagenome]